METKKQIYLLKHKHVVTNKYIGATSCIWLSRDFGRKWGSNRLNDNTKLTKALRASNRQDWEMVQLHDFTENWEDLEAKYIQEYDSFHNGLNSTASGKWESTPVHKKLMSVNGKLRAKPVICSSTIVFDSAAEAGRQLGIYANSISGCCTGKRKSAGGFTWRYA